MPLFEIRPTDHSIFSAEIDAPNAGAVLHRVERLECKEADVLRDGDYCFSVRLAANGIWCIFQRDAMSGPEGFPRSDSAPTLMS